MLQGLGWLREVDAEMELSEPGLSVRSQQQPLMIWDNIRREVQKGLGKHIGYQCEHLALILLTSDFKFPKFKQFSVD